MKTLTFLHQQGLRKVEVGFFRSPEKTTSDVNGCPVDFLTKITALYPDMDWACMLYPSDPQWQAAIGDKLPHISVVRMPCLPDQVEQALHMAEFIHQQSETIQVSLNLICVSSYGLDEIEALLKQIAPSKNVDVVYFADSRGALDPDGVEDIINLGRRICSQPLGFHAHDTQGQAMANSDRAFACGCDWIDVTLNGYGLAGGNTPLGPYLDHHGLLEASTGLAGVKQFYEQHLSLAHPAPRIRTLYRILAEKNLDPVWYKKLEEKYQDDLNGLIQKSPHQHYKTLESALSVLSALV